MANSRGLLLWEAGLTFGSITASGIGLIGVGTPKEAALAVLIMQALNAATIVYKTGQWMAPSVVTPPQPTIVVQGQHSEPPG